MRIALTILTCLAAAPAMAHPGHLADLAGHDHWIAGAAIGAAVLIGLWGVLKPKADAAAEEAEVEDAECDVEEAA